MPVCWNLTKDGGGTAFCPSTATPTSDAFPFVGGEREREVLLFRVGGGPGIYNPKAKQRFEYK